MLQIIGFWSTSTILKGLIEYFNQVWKIEDFFEFRCLASKYWFSTWWSFSGFSKRQFSSISSRCWKSWLNVKPMLILKIQSLLAGLWNNFFSETHRSTFFLICRSSFPVPVHIQASTLLFMLCYYISFVFFYMFCYLHLYALLTMYEAAMSKASESAWMMIPGNIPIFYFQVA